LIFQLLISWTISGCDATWLKPAVTGKTAAPPLFETMAVLGRDLSLERLSAARDRLA